MAKNNGQEICSIRGKQSRSRKMWQNVPFRKVCVIKWSIAFCGDCRYPMDEALLFLFAASIVCLVGGCEGCLWMCWPTDSNCFHIHLASNIVSINRPQFITFPLSALLDGNLHGKFIVLKLLNSTFYWQRLPESTQAHLVSYILGPDSQSPWVTSPNIPSQFGHTQGYNDDITFPYLD